jgi:DNA-binding NtrC family response regulator
VSLVQEALDRQLKLAELEDLYIDRVLEHTRGNKVHAARILGINRRTLYRRGERACSEPEERGVECDADAEEAR